MGLLDSLDDNTRLSLGLLAAAGPRADGAGFGQRLQEAIGSVDAYKQQQQMGKYRQAQIDNYQSEVDQRKAMFENAKRKQEALPTLFNGGSGALSPLMGDPSTGILPSNGRAAMPRSLDVQAALRAGYSPDEIGKLDSLRNVGLNEVARTVKGMKDGREVEQQFDKFGNPVGQGMAQYRAPIEIATGGQKMLLDPYTQKPTSAFKMEQSPDSLASNQLGWANFGISKQREGREALNQDKPVWNESLGGFVDPRKRIVMPAMDSTGRVIEGAGPKMTEDQAKASGWLAQAENAYKNMRIATKQNPDASKPGFNDALAAIPSMGLTTGMANMMRGDTRQNYMQGASSMSEALLRAATGAGVNKDEALQKVRELTPQIGDSDAVIKQKEAAIPIYIESLKLRSGPGAKRVQSIMGNSGGASGDFSGSDPLGLFRK